MQLSATEVRVLSRLIARTLALQPEQREAYLAALPGPQQELVPRIRERLAQLAQTDTKAAVAVAPPLPPPPPPRPQRAEVRVGPYRLVQPLNGREGARVWRAESAESAERPDSTARKAFALRLSAARDADAAPDAATDAAPDARQASAERQVVLLPEHAQIVRLIDAGIDAEGRFYRVLPFVEGLDLVTHARRRGFGLRKRVALCAEACRLVAHVHAGEVACTDLGPALLRVDDDGRMRLLDWGRGRSLRPDTCAADLRALGGLLQALLAGDAGPAAKPLAPGPDVAHVLRRALRIGSARGGAEPYAAVSELVHDLELVLGWQPVPGAGGDAVHRARLWLRRHRARLALGVVGAALVLAVASGGWQAWQRGQGQAQRTDAARAFLQEQLPEALLDASAQARALAATPASAPASAPAGAPAGTPDLAVEAPRVQQALDKARMGFAGEPVLRGQVLTALGVRFRVLGQPEQALAVLQEAETLLQGTSRADEPALGAARAELARQLALEGSAAGRERAAALAQQVLATCTGGACAAARATAQQVLQAVQQAVQQEVLQQGR